MRLNLQEVNENIEKRDKPKADFKSIYKFSLRDNHDGAHAYILQEDASKSYFYKTHTVCLTSKSGKKYSLEVDCIGNDCPLCQEALLHKGEYPTDISYAKDAMYIPLYVIDKRDDSGTQNIGELQIWRRNSKFYSTDLGPFGTRYSPLYHSATEIERVGVRNSKEVTYRLYQADNDFAGNPLVKFDDLSALKEKAGFTESTIYGDEDSFIRQWTKEQMIEAINTKAYPTGKEKVEAEVDVPFDVIPRNRTAVRKADDNLGF